MSRRLWIVGAVVVALLAATGGYLWWRDDDQTALAWAVGHAPAGAQRALLDRLGGHPHARGRPPLGRAPRPASVRHFLDAAYDDDLSSTSALVDVGARCSSERFGFSPASADWELFSQSAQGAAVMLHLPSSVDLDDVADHLRELGYREPDDDDGVWQGGADLVASISSDLTAGAAVRRHRPRRLDWCSPPTPRRTSPSPWQRSTATAPRATGFDAVVDDAGEPLSSAVYAGDYACGALAMAHAGAARPGAGPPAARGGRARSTRTPPSPCPTSRTAACGWPSSSTTTTQARTNADTRATLARGPAPGQGGDLRRPVPGRRR